MKLQTQIGRRYKGKEYRKFLIVVPNETVQELGWREGQELVTEVRGRTLTLRLK